MESSRSRLLFVYSSLRKGFHQSSYYYLIKYFTFVCPAKVKGVVSDIGGEHFATPGDGSCFIKGELYMLNDEHDFSYVFGELDDYEGLVVEQGEQPLYRREISSVYKDNDEIVDAWIYWFNGDVEGKPVVASGDVLNYEDTKNL